MKLYLVRHGQTEANRDKILQGQQDTPLTELGQEQARKIAKRLKGNSFDMIISSDLGRAMDTAKEIAKYHDCEVIPDKRLRERAFGELTNAKVTMELLDQLIQSLEWKPVGGESLNDHVARVKGFLQHFLKTKMFLQSPMVEQWLHLITFF